ncbi:MAG: hypothetical protein QNJ40_12315 [Xanthomonadales bacterium]|nr:hypothetical protein [Xanthomonadales bacterium]
MRGERSNGGRRPIAGRDRNLPLIAAALISLNLAAAPTGGPEPEGSCKLSETERQLLVELVSHPDQRRSGLRCDRTLHKFARERAEDMARRGYFSHRTPERLGPNALLREFGYPLPDSYRGPLGNSVESILGGIRDPESVWREFLGSTVHREHLLGHDEFFESQDEVGVAHVRAIDSKHVDYWVVVIARKERADDPKLFCTPEPAVCFRSGRNSPPKNKPFVP